MSVTVLIADDTESIRKAVKVLLAEESDIRIVGESTPMAEASDLLIISSYMVNNIIGTFGIIRFKTPAASAPFIRGIAKSKIIKSGFSSFDFSSVGFSFAVQGLP